MFFDLLTLNFQVKTYQKFWVRPELVKTVKKIKIGQNFVSLRSKLFSFSFFYFFVLKQADGRGMNNVILQVGR